MQRSRCQLRKFEFEPFLTVANDHSNLAKKLMVKGEKLPAFDVAQLTQELRARILSERDRINVRKIARVGRNCCVPGTTKRHNCILKLKIVNLRQTMFGVFQLMTADIQLVVEPWTAKPEKIEWFALTPKFWRCNLTDLSADQVGFVANAAPRPAWNELAIDCHDSVLPITKIENLFDRQLHCGSVRLGARAVIDGRVRETPVMELRRFIGSGFRAALSEQFGLPYLFGSGELSEAWDTGPETNLGADCSNFVVYAMRRQGQRIPWSNPKQLREHLDFIARSAKPGTPRITAEDLQRGTIVHFGAHVAAVIEDRNPMGILDRKRSCGAPTPWRSGTADAGSALERALERIASICIASRQQNLQARLIFGGDVMLGRSCAAKIQNGTDPFEDISSLVRSASFAAANLECTISNLGAAARIDMRSALQHNPRNCSARPALTQWAWQITMRSILAQSYWTIPLAHLLREEIEAVGVETPTRKACDPSFFSLSDGKRIALLAISDVDPTPNSQTAAASVRAKLGPAITKARSHANLVICLVHWGIENSEKITDEQRELARWLIDRGVDSSLARTHIVYNRSIFITAVQLRIHSVIWYSTARQPSHHGIAARYLRSV